MSKKGGKRKKHRSSSGSERGSGRPSARSIGPKSNQSAAATPSIPIPLVKGETQGETLRFDSQPLSLPTSPERLEAALPREPLVPKIDDVLPPISEARKQASSIPTPSNLSIPP